jgi:hypothetical protein
MRVGFFPALAKIPGRAANYWLVAIAPAMISGVPVAIANAERMKRGQQT